MMSASRHLGEFLVERKVLSRDRLEACLDQEAATGVALVKLLASEGLVHERDITAAVADQFGMRYWEPASMPIPPGIVGMLPVGLARRLRAVAVDIDGARLVVATADAGNEGLVPELEASTGWKVVVALTTDSDLSAALTELYGTDTAAPGPLATSATAGATRELSLNALLVEMLALGASDLHLSAGRPPTIRVNGAIRPMADHDVLNGSEIRQMVYGVLSQRLRERFEEHRELDTSHSVPDAGRFRLNVFLQKDSVGAVLRAIPFRIVPLAKLGIPAVVAEFAEFPRGLVLVTGPTGSGKSTTLASLVDVINTQRPVHIMTVEDPIEFLHDHKRAVVNQREVGEDTDSFAQALKHVLRQDPDVILVGELRDLETIQAALTAAETGHLVYATLHTQDAPQSIDRIIDVFPAYQQKQVRVQLASVLQAVVTQQLLPTPDRRGRVAVCEVLVATPAVRNLIREGKTHQIYSSMQAGGKFGMQTMDQALAALVRQSKISMEVALAHCQHPEDLTRQSAPH